MAREYVPVFFEWLDDTQDLTNEEKGKLIDAVVSYASGKEYEHLLTGGCKIAFRFMKGQIDRNNVISEARSKAGSSKAEQTETNANKTKQTEANANKREQTTTNLPKEKENKNEKEKEKENENKRECVVTAQRFTPPTREEIDGYLRENRLEIDADRFMNYYQSNGWMVGQNHMQDWKAAIRNWAAKDRKERAEPAGTVLAQQYGQRDYSGVDAEIRERTARKVEEFLRQKREAEAAAKAACAAG